LSDNRKHDFHVALLNTRYRVMDRYQMAKTPLYGLRTLTTACRCKPCGTALWLMWRARRVAAKGALLLRLNFGMHKLKYVIAR